jgi:hypothetical protein
MGVLSINQKSERMSDSKLLLAALMEEKASDFQQIMTGDESRFFLYYSRDSVWGASCDELPQRIKQKSDTQKCLVSILCSVNGIHSPLDVSKGTAHNTAFFTGAAMPSLIEGVRSRTLGKTLNDWLIHRDNRDPHSLGQAQTHIEASSN